MSKLRNYIVIDRRKNSLNGEKATSQLVSRNTAACVIPSNSEVFIKVESDLQNSNQPNTAGSSGSTLKFDVESSWERTEKASSNCERSNIEQVDIKLSPNNVAIKEESDLSQDERKLDGANLSGNVNHNFEIEKVWLGTVKEEPCDAPSEVMAPSKSTVHDSDVSFTEAPSVVIKEENVEEEEGVEALITDEFEVQAEQQDNWNPEDTPLQTLVKCELGDERQSNIHYDRDRIRLGEASVVLNDLFPKNQAEHSKTWTLADSALKLAPHSHNFKNSNSPEKMRSCVETKMSEENCQSGEQLAVREWYSCTVCPARFKFVSSLAQHFVQIHYLFLCVDCETTFKARSAYIDHLVNSHLVKKLLSCSFCHFVCQSLCDLRVHIKVHADQKLYSCGQCFAEFYEAQALKFHLIKCARQSTCAPEVSIKTELRTDVPVYKSEDIVTCPFCAAKVKWRLDTRLKLLSAQGHSQIILFPCKSCSNNILVRLNLKGHTLKDTNEKSPSNSDSSQLNNNDLQNISSVERPSNSISVKNLKLNLVMQSSEIRFSCSYCTSTFKSEADLKEHVISHTNLQLSHRPDCSGGSGPESDVSQRQTTHTDEQAAPCPLCPKKFSSRINLEEHLALHTKKKKLVVCLNENTNEKLVSSSHCSRILRSQIDSEEHLALHTKKKRVIVRPKDGTSRTLEISSCNQKIGPTSEKSGFCPDQKASKPHQKTFSLSCPVCSTRFRLTKQHIFHGLLSCSVCEARFRLKDKHLSKIRVKAKGHTCPDCHIRFKSIHSLRHHQIIMSHLKPFTCGSCHAQFKFQSSLKQHQIIHTNEKRYSCEHCSWKFRLRSNLEKHMAAHANGSLSPAAGNETSFSLKISLKNEEKI